MRIFEDNSDFLFILFVVVAIGAGVTLYSQCPSACHNKKCRNPREEPMLTYGYQCICVEHPP